jgi:uncharacterized damage-inducible protein DinB
MLIGIDAFLRYFEGVNKRALRDVGLLPDEAQSWAPPAGTGETAWGIGQIVGHMAASRLFFLRAYCGEGWIAQTWSLPMPTRDEWHDALRSSGNVLRERLTSTPDSWVTRKIEPLDPKDNAASGWRLLLLMTEHDVHHRSQIVTYASVMGWPVAHIYGRSAEEVGLAPLRE